MCAAPGYARPVGVLAGCRNHKVGYIAAGMFAALVINVVGTRYRLLTGIANSLKYFCVIVVPPCWCNFCHLAIKQNLKDGTQA